MLRDGQARQRADVNIVEQRAGLAAKERVPSCGDRILRRYRMERVQAPATKRSKVNVSASSISKSSEGMGAARQNMFWSSAVLPLPVPQTNVMISPGTMRAHAAPEGRNPTVEKE
jgi:hypothetical protein